MIAHDNGLITTQNITPYANNEASKFTELPGEPSVLIGVGKANDSGSGFPLTDITTLSGKGFDPVTFYVAERQNWVLTTAITVALKNPPTQKDAITKHLAPTIRSKASSASDVEPFTVANEDGTVDVHFIHATNIQHAVTTGQVRGPAISIDGGAFQKIAEGKLTPLAVDPDILVAVNFSQSPEAAYQTGYDPQPLTSTRGRGVIALKNKSTSSTAGSCIVQMPTTGAPEGLSSVGLFAAGVCLLGVLTVLVRRRRV